MKKILIILILFSNTCKSQNQEIIDFNNIQFKMELDIIIEYINETKDKTGNISLIEVMRINNTSITIIPVKVINFKNYLGYVLYKNKFIVFDNMFTKKIITTILNDSLAEMNTLICEKCNADEATDMIDEFDYFNFEFINDNFLLNSVELHNPLKYIEIRNRIIN